MFQLIMTVLKVVLKTPFVKNNKTILKLDKWLEYKIGLDIIKQEQKWFVKHPLLLERIEKLETDVEKLKK
tara:strand:+ start:3394 stop:3603 length:210 start_codon:yes stop_codon:yes gene_type:complete